MNVFLCFIMFLLMYVYVCDGNDVACAFYFFSLPKLWGGGGGWVFIKWPAQSFPSIFFIDCGGNPFHKIRMIFETHVSSNVV